MFSKTDIFYRECQHVIGTFMLSYQKETSEFSKLQNLTLFFAKARIHIFEASFYGYTRISSLQDIFSIDKKSTKIKTHRTSTVSSSKELC